jgi:hypothetical protein
MLATLTPAAMPLYASTLAAKVGRASDVNVNLADRSIAITRASDGSQLTLRSQQPNRVFGYSVQHHADVNGDGFNDVIVASPPTSAETAGGDVLLINSETGQPIWQTPGPAGMRSGYLALLVDDQDLDKVPDVIVACYDSLLAPQTWLLSGKDGRSLTVVKQNIYSVIDLLEQGKELFSPTDIDGSKTVDMDDVIEFSTAFSAASVRGDIFNTAFSADFVHVDIIKDDVLNNDDLTKVFDDFFSRKELIKDKVDAASVVGGLAAIVLRPENTDPWCHDIWLAGMNEVPATVAAGPAHLSPRCSFWSRP